MTDAKQVTVLTSKIIIGELGRISPSLIMTVNIEDEDKQTETQLKFKTETNLKQD